MKYIFVLAALLTLQGCGPINYTPEEYVIENNRVGRLDVRGIIKLINSQDDITQTVFFNAPSSWVGNYSSVTEHFKWQLEKEINENRIEPASGGNKSIDIKVTKLVAEPKGFHYVSKMDAEYKLGNGQTGTIHVSQGSPNNMWGVLNGTIALGVIEILKEEKVRQYLSI